MSDEQVLSVPSSAAGVRLDFFLAEHVGSRSVAQKLIAHQAVRIVGIDAPIKNRFLLVGGESIVVEHEQRERQFEIAGQDDSLQVGYQVVFEDEDLFIVDKAAGVVVHPGPGHQENTLVQQLAGKAAGGSDPQRPGIVHRLDQGTSGLLVIAKNDETHRALQQALMQRQVTREYVALVVGCPAAKEGLIDAPIGPDAHYPTRVSLDSRRSRAAQTEFAIEEIFKESSLLSIRLHTGRTHQIRVHLAAIDLPICGDKTYGKPTSYGLERQFLHARKLSFLHPRSSKKVQFESALPVDLQQALQCAKNVGL